MPSGEEELGIHALASLDEMLRKLDAQIAAIELAAIPRPTGRVDSPKSILALQAEVDQLCTQRAVNMREQHRWMVEAERAIRENNDVRAKDALTRHADYLRLVEQADAQLAELRAMIIEVRRALSPRESRNDV